MVRKKKKLGQHFLRDENIAMDIANLIIQQAKGKPVLEIGPGMGMLTQFLNKEIVNQLYLVELDHRFIDALKDKFPIIAHRIYNENVLKWDFNQIESTEFFIGGNFPYNISSQIIFTMIANRERCIGLAGMFQKELAERVCAKEGSKTYGVISVLTQLYYKTEYQFNIPPEAFDPPPRVWSAIITLQRIERPDLPEYKIIARIVKTAFLQRRKKIKNALSSLIDSIDGFPEEFLDLRAEQISVEQYVDLAKKWKPSEL
ncbi:UNVERIFIED_CONTAM: hypothetical protein GTU68_014279 [Idotea baltica]|nr:hypothetical protein [Idotea baltica]